MAMSSLWCDEVWSHPDKPLRTHLVKVAEIAKHSANAIPLNLLAGPIISEASNIMGLYHDIGKATRFFQSYLKESDSDQKAKLKNKPETNHSLISAVATYFAVEALLKDKNFDSEFTSFLPIASFLAVRRHHTNLQSAIEDLRLENINILITQVNNLCYEYLSFLPYWNRVYNKLKMLSENGWPLRKQIFTQLSIIQEQSILSYLIQNILYSLLLDADKHEVTVGSFFERKSLQADMVEVFQQLKGFNKSTKPIDVFRNEIYQVVINQVKDIDLDQDHLLSLSAPTGSGKTLTSLAFALKLRERIISEKRYRPRIIYTLPFLSIIDQNAEVINEVFKTTLGKIPTSDQFLIHHHLSDYTYRDENSEYEPDKSEILIEGWDSEIIITTFVQLFHTLFSNQNHTLRKFHKIAGSIVILDEIQTLPHKYWQLFKETAETMAKYFNTYFILSTATQPAIFTNAKELLPEKEKYFKFFNRTQIAFDIRSSKKIAEFAEEFNKSLENNPKSTMVVLNTVRSAEDFYRAVKETAEKLEYKIYFLSSYVIPKIRLQRIEEIRNSSAKKLVISTQLVEAGVDIDLERIIRDLGPIDSINQVAGRANRHQNKKLGEVEIIILEDDKKRLPFYSYIYDPVLIDNTKRILQSHSTVTEENFLDLTAQYYRQILQTISDDVSRKYLEALKMLNYEIISEFNLIEKQGEKVDIFVELDDEATVIWEKYQETVMITDLWERKKCFSQIKGDFYRYVISVALNKAKANLPAEVSGIRFVSRNQLTDYYDLETGYKATSELAIW